MPQLIRPDARLRDSYLAAMREFAAEHRAGDGSGLGRDLVRYADTWGTDDGFAAFVADKIAEASGEVAADWVHSTTLWWVEGSGDAREYLGRLAIRHELNDELREVGGHIGYDVRASRRREGHATAMLRAALPLARALGVRPALVTCDVDNVASRKVIEANGGVLEDRRGGKLRFWVPT